MDKKEVENISKLARLKFQDKELEAISKDMEKIIDWIDILQSADLSGLKDDELTANISLPIREDEVKIGNLSEKLLSNSTDRYESFFTVPKVVD